MALVRLRYPHGNYKPFRDLLATTPEVTEAHARRARDVGSDAEFRHLASEMMATLPSSCPMPG